LVELRLAAIRAGEARRQQVLRVALVPGVGALLVEEVGHPTAEVAPHHGLATALAVEGDDGHSPEPLARDAPVGPRRDHVVDALLAPRGHPLDLVDRLERALAQASLAVEGDEPLLGGAED